MDPSLINLWSSLSIMPLSLSIWQVALLLNPVYVTLFWAIVLSFYDSDKHTPKVFLGKFMMVSFVLYLSHFFYFSGKTEVYYYFDSFYQLASLLVYPLYHIYIRLLTSEQQFSLRFHARYLLLPFAVFFLYLAGHILMTPQQHSEFLLQTSIFYKNGDVLQQYMSWVYAAARMVFIGQVFYYLFANFRLIIRNNERLQDYYSNTEGKRLQWVQFFNFSLALTSIASIAAAITGREAFAAGEYSLAGPSLIFSSMLFFIGLLGNTQNKVHTPLMEEKEEATDIPGKTTPLEIPESKLKQELDGLFNRKEIFKDPDLKIWDLSKMLGTNRTYISRFINQEYNRNFYNHVNHYRVEYIKKIAEENP